MNASYLTQQKRNRAASIGLVAAAHAVVAMVAFTHHHAAVRLVQRPISVMLVEPPAPPPPPPPKPVALALALPPPPPLAIPDVQVDMPPPPAATLAVAVAAAAVLPPAAASEPAAVAPAVPAPDTPPSADASAAGNPKPIYPKASRALGEEGRVLLDVFVQADGVVGDIRVHQSSGFDRLDEAALKAVRQWHFRPAREAGREIAMWYQQPITFNLHNA